MSGDLEAFGEFLADIQETLRAVLDRVDGHRATLIAHGYSAASAEEMAVAVHNAFVAAAFKVPE